MDLHTGHTGKPKVGVNAAQCRLCSDVLISRHVHDYVICKCGAIAIDGGTQYKRRIGDMAAIIELDEVLQPAVPKPNSGRIVAVDFDGTIVEHGFPDIGEPLPQAFEVLRYWQSIGVRLVLYTMRSNRGHGKNYLMDAVEFCRRLGVEFWAVNSNPEQVDWTSSPKVHADYYVDDRGVGMKLIKQASDEARLVVDWPWVDATLTPRLEEAAAVPKRCIINVDNTIDHNC